MEVFRPKDYLPAELISQVTELRVTDPELPLSLALSRRRRAQLTLDGRLNILAADHPARRVLAVGGDRLGMADRHDYLARILRVLRLDAVDGIMATMDILEDLLVLDELLFQRGGGAGGAGRDGTSLLDDKLLIASLNRGGLQGVSWEMDDPMTGALPSTVAAWNLDGAKILLRICDQEPDSLKTIVATAGTIAQMNELRAPLFLEPLPVIKTDKGYQVEKAAEALAKIVGVASALGDSSRFLWLKLPYCENYQAVVRATTLPILLLGGESTGDPTKFMREVEAGMAAGPNVRGVLVGRNVLYPGEGDPAVAAAAIGRIVHGRG